MSINKLLISGNLTRDPETRRTAGGTAVMSFGVAVNERAKDANGEWVDRPNFVDCVMFGTRAEAVGRYLSKGGKVAIEGKLRWSQWQTQDGQKRSKLEVIVDEIEFMSRSEQQGGAPAQQAYAPAADVYSEDIPF